MFYIFLADPPKYSDVYRAFKGDEYADAEIECAYLGWLKQYCRRMEAYYDGILDREFIRENEGLRDFVQSGIDYFEAIRPKDGDGLHGMPALLDEFLQIVTYLNSDAKVLRYGQISEWWFNKLVENPPDEQSRLKALPYGEYLRSRHWQQVRAAMLILGNAHCQETKCRSIGDTYWGNGWETALHIHHLSYKNRGCERFADLTLLCEQHHQLWHEAKKKRQPAPFEIYDLRNEAGLSRNAPVGVTDDN